MTVSPNRITRRAFISAAFRHAAIPVQTAAPLFRQYTATPRLDSAHWGLVISGEVSHPVVWSHDDLFEFPQIELQCTMLCASNPPGGERIGHAAWQGVPLRYLLNEVEPAREARYARLEGADGHITGITLDQLRSAVLAFTLDGDALSPEQGYPARLIVPGLYDHKSPRWIERIDLVSSPVSGMWEQRGYSADGGISPTSGFTSPRTGAGAASSVLFQGYAYAGEYVIERVDISIDGGAWMPVPFEPASPNVWTRWQIAWQAPSAGEYVARVRAADRNGRIQPSDATHAIVVRVGA